MKPETAEDSVFLSEAATGKGAEAAEDEAVSGDYGLVINGHSLVRGGTSASVTAGGVFGKP